MKSKYTYSKVLLASLITIVSCVVLVMCSGQASAADQLSVTCSVNVTNNNALWSATSTGGVSPRAFLWSGDSAIAGTTSAQVPVTYLNNGTFIGTLQVTDASSTVATTSCQAVVNYFSTSTPIVHAVVEADSTLQVTARGGFTANNMIVQSVGASSFTGRIWGALYTVNIASGTSFLPRAFGFSDVKVGDQMNVVGKVASSTPLVVTANSVRDLSLVASSTRGHKPWKYHHEAKGFSKKNDKHSKGNDEKNNNGWGLGNKLPFLNWLKR